MSDKPQAAKQGKGLKGFYIAIAIVALVAVGLYFSWTPLRLSYLEGRVRNAGPATIDIAKITSESIAVPDHPRLVAARELARIGPASLPAFRRLLADEDPAKRIEIQMGLSGPLNGWALPLLIEIARKGRTPQERHMAMWGCDYTTGLEHAPKKYDPAKLDEGCRKLEAWWEKEGEAQYGPGGPYYWPPGR